MFLTVCAVICLVPERQVSLVVSFHSNRCANNLSPASLCPCYPKSTKYRNAPKPILLKYFKDYFVFFFSSAIWMVYLLTYCLCFAFLQLITLVDYFPDTSAFSQLTSFCRDYFVYGTFLLMILVSIYFSTLYSVIYLSFLLTPFCSLLHCIFLSFPSILYDSSSTNLFRSYYTNCYSSKCPKMNGLSSLSLNNWSLIKGNLPFLRCRNSCFLVPLPTLFKSRPAEMTGKGQLCVCSSSSRKQRCAGSLKKKNNLRFLMHENG